MKLPELYVGGKRLPVAKQIAKGGEGTVYLLDGPYRKAVKVYFEDKRADREAKVSAMVKNGLAQSSSLVAYPDSLVSLRSGEFAGFTMRLVEGFHELHQLYGPKDRKTHFPKADFRFLVRAAANTARAVAQVHSSPCVIGDLNESGILVSSEAMVALIDADSFQFEIGGKLYPCLVGKPDFTAPELHGRSLQGVPRTKEHDNFALAVSIFRLLFMGRHPYAGQLKGSDLSLDQMIAANLFAYSRNRKTGVSPPGILPSLDDFPADISNGFERAFGLNPADRPSASEWVSMLQGLERQFSRCSTDGMHFYPSTAKKCPWCRMEAATGAMLFISTVATVGKATVNLVNFNVDKAWAAIKAVVLPDPNTASPPVPTFNLDPSEDAKKAKSGKIGYKLLSGAAASGGVAGFAYFPDAFIVWLIAFGVAWSQFDKGGPDKAEWRRIYSQTESEWDRALSEWRKSTGLTGLIDLHLELEDAVEEYKGLSAKKAKAQTKLQNDRRNRQLTEYLDRFLIRRASISGIGQAKKAVLVSYGIESAADVKQNAILNIPGFGPATADKLMKWRAGLERRFQYNPNPTPSDAAAQAKLDADFANRASALAKKIDGGQAELQQSAAGMRSRLQQANPRLTALAEQRAQLEADLAFLGIPKPSRPARAAIPVPSTARPKPIRQTVLSPSPSPSPPPPPATASGGVSCPRCGSRMVRRVARRGRNAGNSFWGCSRYPSCKGTRS
ncbi:DNA-binding helix-hairpin-helix protein with protein kinase domain [Porphyrobacter sp. MBR-155]|jgi:DNA-binding helix-hairpin-helix protein with protein kinase domain|uniref:topoisomerase DNA-binding C4 zinc finger domain-containing protein n=1 Tax=Porphyrobacter sp. MBR-155 TaxID=3156464 RepID=UPI00339A8CB2